MVTWQQTIHYLRADFNRRCLFENKSNDLLNRLPVLFHRGMVSVIMYRLSHYCVHNRMGFLYRFFVLIEHLYTKSEISPLAKLGPGLVMDGIGNGIPSATTVGQNCTFLGCNTLTLGGMERYDLTRDNFVIGDHCVFGVGARVIRPIELASGTQIMPNSVVVLTEPKVGSTVSGIPARRRRIDPLDEIFAWNPFSGERMRHAGYV